MSKPVMLAELPYRPGYTVEFEVPAEPEHHVECECEQCEACIPAQAWREEEERREALETLEQDATLPEVWR